jgi:hypothetical protein
MFAAGDNAKSVRRMGVQFWVQQIAPALVVRVHHMYSAIIRHQGSTFICPLEDRALQIEDIGSSGLHQLRGCSGRTHAYGAVKHDWFLVRRCAHGGRDLAGCLRPDGSGQVTDFVLFARTHVDEQRGGPIFGRHPLGEFARAHLWHFRPIALYPGKYGVPGDGVFLSGGQHRPVDDQDWSDQQKSNCRRQLQGSSRWIGLYKTNTRYPLVPDPKRRTKHKRVCTWRSQFFAFCVQDYRSQRIAQNNSQSRNFVVPCSGPNNCSMAMRKSTACPSARPAFGSGIEISELAQ